MKTLALALAVLIMLVQYPLWLGKGSWLRVWELDQQIRTQRDANGRLRARNSALEAEVRDLKVGLEAIEERARSELGMIRQDEIFFQVLEDPQAARPQPPRP
jgi:cell division protein FtsB